MITPCAGDMHRARSGGSAPRPCGPDREVRPCGPDLPVDDFAGSTANGAQVQLYDCNGTGAQRWTRG